MTSKERVLTALQHKEPDRVPIDLGGMMSTGITGIAYNQLKAHLDITTGKTRIYDMYQQLAEPELQILEKVGADVISVLVTQPMDWKESKLPDGSACEIGIDYNPKLQPDGSIVMLNEKNEITAKMAKGSHYFDTYGHLLENVSTIDQLKGYDFFAPIDDESLAVIAERAKRLHETTDYAFMLSGFGVCEWAESLRGWGNFMMDIAGDPEFAGYLLDMLLDEGRLVRTGGGIVYRREDFERMTDAVRTHIEENGSISLAETRDLFGTSRKYAQAVLEELDMRRITRREGDVRLLRDRERPQI